MRAGEVAFGESGTLALTHGECATVFISLPSAAFFHGADCSFSLPAVSLTKLL